MISRDNPQADQNRLDRSLYRPEIDGLRALAIVAVIINHFNAEILPSGYLGVDIFFVISGFVITSSLTNRPSKNFGDFLLGFYARRVKRLVPALVTCVVITSLLVCLVNPDPVISLQTGKWSLFGLSNLYLLKQATDYFGEAAELNVFTQTWSLGVEEQFYGLFPFVYWFSLRARPLCQGGKKSWRSLLLPALVVASLIGFIWLNSTNPSAAYFLMPTRIWELGAGCLLFSGLKDMPKPLTSVLAKVRPLWVIGAIGPVCFMPLQFNVLATIATVGLTALLIAAIRPQTAAYSLLTKPQVVYLGRISYSLYLWHWSVLSLSRLSIGLHWWSVPFQVGLMLLLAVVSYRCIEKPLRRVEWSIVRWQAIGRGLLAIIGAMVLVLGISTFVQAKVFLDGSRIGQRDLGKIYLEREYWNNQACTASRTTAESIDDFSKCQIKLSSNVSPVANRKIFWYGDSYAEQLAPAVALIAREQNLSVNLFVTSGCPATTKMQYTGETTPGFCANTFKAFWRYVMVNSQAGDVLVLSNSLHYWEPGTALIRLERGQFVDAAVSYPAYLNELTSLAQQAKAAGIRLAVTSDIPILNRDPNICVYWFSQLHNKCGGPLVAVKQSQYRRQAYAEMKSLADRDRQSQLRTIDLYEPVAELFATCGGDCYSYYRDANHLSRKGAFSVKDHIAKAILSD
jgi:peptidoglycan/LPS O-acetylase OafA/YrhL